MKKNLLVGTVLFFATLSVYAQADLEAKAAYMLAEQSYGKGEMKDALQYLDEASSKLGGANAKILYLKIMAQRELANKDLNYLAKLDSSVAFFQSAPDIGSFNEEKKLEVMMIKLQVKKELAKIPTEAEMKTMAVIGIKAYQDAHPYWTLGAPLETVKTNHPEYFVYFNRKENKPGIVTNPFGTSYVQINVTAGTSVVTFTSNKLKRYQEKYFEFKNDDSGHTQGRAALKPVLEDFRSKFGYLPSPKIENITQNNLRIETYEWKAGEKSVTLVASFSRIDVDKTWRSSCFSEIIDKSIN